LKDFGRPRLILLGAVNRKDVAGHIKAEISRVQFICGDQLMGRSEVMYTAHVAERHVCMG
jgi:hypothetical protein